MLDLDSTANCLNDTWKFGDDAIASLAEDTAAMCGDCKLQDTAIRTQRLRGDLVVELRKVTVPSHIRSENRSKSTFHGKATPSGQHKTETTSGS